MKDYKTVLTDGETIEIVVAEGTVKLDSNGILKVDAGTFGFTRDLFETEPQSTYSGQLSNARCEPAKADSIQQYLYMLFEAQKAKHDVHKEIGDALKEYKAELNI